MNLDDTALSDADETLRRKLQDLTKQEGQIAASRDRIVAKRRILGELRKWPSDDRYQLELIMKGYL